MAKKSLWRRIGEKLGIVKPEVETTPSAPATPPMPTIPPHPRRTPDSELTIEQRVARYKKFNPAKRRELRPQDEDSEFWRLYDGGH